MADLTRISSVGLKVMFSTYKGLVTAVGRLTSAFCILLYIMVIYVCITNPRFGNGFTWVLVLCTLFLMILMWT